MKRLIELLHSEGCSCVIESQGEIRAFRQRGVADLYDLYQNKRDFMQNAQLADIWGIERSGFFNDRGKWVKSFENQRV